MSDGGGETAIEAVEGELGVRFPSDYRQFVIAPTTHDGDFGEAWLHLYRLDELVEMNRDYELGQMLPGFVLIGSNGGGEAVGFDFRNSVPPVVLVPFIGPCWEEALPQAPSFSDFMEQRRAGLPYRFAP